MIVKKQSLIISIDKPEMVTAVMNMSSSVTVLIDVSEVSHASEPTEKRDGDIDCSGGYGVQH